jgi:hypothetical protein
LAVVVRVLGIPQVELEDHLPAGKTEAQVRQVLGATMSAFELSERVRSAMLQRLPAGPPFADLAPANQVDSALGSLLTVERVDGPPNFQDLRPLGVDGVLYVEIAERGAVVDEGRAVLFLRGQGRMFTLDGDSTEWREPFDLRGPADGLQGDWLAGGDALHSIWSNLSEHVGQKLAVSLGGTSEPHGGTPALQTPDIPDEGHPPEKLKPVLPFIYDVDAGPVDAGPPPRDAGPADAGDPLFPGVLPR